VNRERGDPDPASHLEHAIVPGQSGSRILNRQDAKTPEEEKERGWGFAQTE